MFANHQTSDELASSVPDSQASQAEAVTGRRATGDHDSTRAEPVDSQQLQALRIASPSVHAPFAFREIQDVPPEIAPVIRMGGAVWDGERPRVLVLDKRVDSPVEVYAGTQLLGYGKLVVVDGVIGVEVTDVVAEVAEQRRRCA